MDEPVSREAASEAVTGIGWRYVLGTLRGCVRVDSLAAAADLGMRLVAVCGADADRHLSTDLRRDRVMVALQSQATFAVTARDVELARRISAAVAELGLATVPGVDGRPVQVLEIAIDAMDIPSVRPFWKAIMGYADEVGGPDPDVLIDPYGQGPAIWFQQMDAPRPQRNRIHIDISVPHDDAPRRLQAALAAGGRVVFDARAPSWWVLADPEGNEACITTWQGRD
jgi:4a-hydroxytetrahydrobiopterin dehydratase